MKNIAIIGYSGHAFVVLDACKKKGVEVQYYCELTEISHNPYQLTYYGDETSPDFDWQNLDAFVLGIGENKIRDKVANLILLQNKEILNVIHPTAVINDFVSLGKGNFIGSNVNINPLVNIGNNCILNTGSIIEHECTIGNSAHVASGVVLAGNVIVGDLTFIGANAVVKQGVKIGENVIIGAGSVVLKDIADNEVWAGNPVKRLSN